MDTNNIIIVVVIVLIVLFVLGYFGRGRFRG
jgi:flagellar basal body-associated protein FliL